LADAQTELSICAPFTGARFSSLERQLATFK
jgi:hypothetical protein